ncbi:MAG: hypothetical protein BIFFINMI_01197 [Phycisphaerae bacterium]|nr:hypothetical protein [Phycisphaerae bacterium]
MAVNPLLRLAAWIAGRNAQRNLNAFLRACDDAPATQQRVLARHVAASAASRFGADFGLAGIRTPEEFAARVPVQTYESLSPYIEPIKTGDVTSLFNPGTRVRMFAMTSGTTGQAKYLPVTDRYLADYHRSWNAWGIAMYRDHMDAWLRTILQVTSPMDETQTEAGIPAGSISGFIQRHQKKIVERFYAVPAAVSYIKDPDAKYYTIMRLSLTRDIAMIATANPSTTLRLAQTGERQADSLIRDIREGTLRADLEVAPEIRTALARRLAADPARAAALERLASRRGRLLPMDYWNVAVLNNWTGGTVGLYVRKLVDYFGDVPVRDLGLIASEARMSIPMQDAGPAGVLEVTGSFYEFIPADQIDAATPDVLRCHELVEGGEYFILLTTGGGLFRYNIGDLVRCEGFVGRAPVIAFLNKGKHVSSVTGEKLTEHQAVTAAERVSARLGVPLEAFVLCPRWADPPHYALNVEPGGTPALRWADLCAELDAELARLNIEYQQKRSSGRLGPIAWAPVADGFLAELQERQIRQRQGRREQYKHQFLYTQVDADGDFARPAAVESRSQAR